MFGPLVLGLVMLVCLGLIVLLSETVSEKLNWVGVAFLVSAFFNIFPFAALIFGYQIATSFLKDNSKDIPFVQPLVNSLFSPVILRYMLIGGATIVIFFVASFTLFILGRTKKKKA